jgi:uncharacterized membrane protein YhiD involved in acid resistance
MNIKTLAFIVIGVSVFVGIYLFTMVGALALLVGFGFGIWWHNWINDIFKNLQKRIYLSEKADMEHRKKELEAELNKLKMGD